MGGVTYSNDTIGNRTSDGTWSYTWEHGRQLAGMTKSGTSISYDYGADGYRISKAVTEGCTTTTYNYFYSGGKLIHVSWNDSDRVHIFYNSNGSPISILYNGTRYYYVKNVQGDIVGLTTTSGLLRVAYTYDAWGKPLTTTGSMAGTLGQVNPLRYRGYVYDEETGLYYLGSRYYDPGVGRFINAEPNVDQGEFDENAGILGFNVFCYCANNPVLFKDDGGDSILLCVLIGAGIGLLAGGGYGAYTASKKGYSPNDGWAFWKYVVGYGVVGGSIGALIGWSAGVLIAKYGVATAATSITKGGGARFSSFRALKHSLGSAGAGKEWHHIVEQCQIQKSGFSKYWIQNSNNVINISKSVHTKISAYYNSIQSFTNGKIFRNWLAGQSFEEQYRWGIKVLRMFEGKR